MRDCDLNPEERIEISENEEERVSKPLDAAIMAASSPKRRMRDRPVSPGTSRPRVSTASARFLFLYSEAAFSTCVFHSCDDHLSQRRGNGLQRKDVVTRVDDRHELFSRQLVFFANNNITNFLL